MSATCDHVLGMSQDYESTPIRASELPGLVAYYSRPDQGLMEGPRVFEERTARTPAEHVKWAFWLTFNFCPDCGKKLPPAIDWVKP